MLGEDGRPRKELLRADGLHMTDAGYAIWNEKVRGVVEETK
jgi:lysophospholipase L1-like esterase